MRLGNVIRDTGIMHDYGLDLISEPDVRMHDDSNMSDSVFSDVPMAKAQTNEVLHFMSDYKMF